MSDHHRVVVHVRDARIRRDRLRHFVGRAGAPVRLYLEPSLGSLPVGGEMVLAAKHVILHSGRMRDGRVKAVEVQVLRHRNAPRGNMGDVRISVLPNRAAGVSAVLVK